MLTPIGAYRALAQPQMSCLLESVESGGRISRYSFIGLDYRAAKTFGGDGPLYEPVREFVRSHWDDGENGSLGGALLAFSYDAARFDARLPARPAAEPEMPAAYVAIPSTWLIFDHFTDTLTIWASDGDAASRNRRIDGYVDRLLAAKPAFPGPTRAAGPVTASIDRERYLELAREVKRRIFEGDVYQLQLGIRFGADLAVATPSISIARCAGATLPPTFSSSIRSSASSLARHPSFWCAWRGARLAFVRWPERARAAVTTMTTRRSRRSC